MSRERPSHSRNPRRASGFLVMAIPFSCMSVFNEASTGEFETSRVRTKDGSNYSLKREQYQRYLVVCNTMMRCIRLRLVSASSLPYATQHASTLDPMMQHPRYSSKAIP